MQKGNWNGEVKINKDILKYQEQVFMGLNLKQTLSGAAAIILAVLIYFVSHKTLGRQLSIILCAIGAAPVAAIGFLKFNGLTFIQLIKALIQHYIMPDKLIFKAENFYKGIIALDKYLISKEEKKTDAKIVPRNQTNGEEIIQSSEDSSEINTY